MSEKKNEAFYRAVYDRAAELLEAHFQSKKAKLKKQVTHWYGKFMIVKAENNRLRTKIRRLEKPEPDEIIGVGGTPPRRQRRPWEKYIMKERASDKCQDKSQSAQDTHKHKSEITADEALSTG